MYKETIYQFVLCFVFISDCYGGIEHIDLNYTNAKVAYDELYMDGRTAYDKGDYQNAAIFFERAISDYRLESDVKAQCWIKCSESLKHTQTVYQNLFDGQLNFLHYGIKTSSCHTLCKEKFLGRRGRISKDVQVLFEKKEPYSFLQHCYFKLGEYSKSLSAGFTHFVYNTQNVFMKEHINELLKTSQGKTWESLRSLEELPHLTLYRDGEEAYSKQDYKTCVSSFEESLTLFFKELAKCHSTCEEQHEKREVSFAASQLKHYSAILTCRRRCQIDLTNLDGRTSARHFVPYYYHYLQFCYFQVGNYVEAMTAAETYLMLVPDDPVMSENIELYEKQPGMALKDINPRPRAKTYLKQFAVEINLQKIVRGYLEDIETDGDLGGLNSIDDQMLDNIYNMVTDELEGEAKLRGEMNKKNDVHTLKKDYRNPNRWKQHEDVKNSILLMEEEALNGTDRVAFDNVASDEECQLIMELVKKLTTETNNRLIEQRVQQLKELTNASINLAQSGDGYKHSHPDAEHPFTRKEKFEGVTVHSAVNASMSGKVGINETELYLRLSDRVRILTQEYFDLPKRLNFAFTHLVCRHALEDAITEGEEHLSHPVHSDNCLINADGPGTCPERAPAYTWRDYSALLYLNDDFLGGDFIFANHKSEIQARVRPKCGRMVAFRSKGVRNLHGVLGVRKGTRCALPIWFTLSEKKGELEMERYLAAQDFHQFKQQKKSEKKKEEL